MSLEPLTSFLNAVKGRDVARVRELLDAGGIDADADHPWIEGRALHHACHDPLNLELLELIIRQGVEIDARHPETGGTALHQLLHAEAPLDEKFRALDLLLAHGADINAVGEEADEVRYTAVDIARTAGKPASDMLAALEERGGRPAPDDY